MRHSRAVIDTNVLYAGLYSTLGASFQILNFVEEHRLVPILSTALLFEYKEVLNRNHDTLGLSAIDIEDILDSLCCRGENRKIHFLWRPQLRDVKDDLVLELAVAAGGADIITHNTRDFDAAVDLGVRIVTPSMALKELR